MSNFYLIYDEKDKDTAIKLETCLKKWRFEVLSARNNLPGDDNLNKIKEALKRDKYILVLVSNNYVTSYRLNAIVSNAINKNNKSNKRNNRKIIPVIIEPINKDEELIDFVDITSIDLIAWNGDYDNKNFQKLYHLIEEDNEEYKGKKVLQLLKSKITITWLASLSAILTLIVTILLPELREFLRLNPPENSNSATSELQRTNYVSFEKAKQLAGSNELELKATPPSSEKQCLYIDGTKVGVSSSEFYPRVKDCSSLFAEELFRLVYDSNGFTRIEIAATPPGSQKYCFDIDGTKIGILPNATDVKARNCNSIKEQQFRVIDDGNGFSRFELNATPSNGQKQCLYVNGTKIGVLDDASRLKVADCRPVEEQQFRVRSVQFGGRG